MSDRASELPEGSVTLDRALTVLTQAAPHCNYSIDIKDGNSVTLVKDGIPEVYDLPEVVPRKMLQRLSHKYGIRIEWFFHPHMLIPGDNKQH